MRKLLLVIAVAAASCADGGDTEVDNASVPTSDLAALPAGVREKTAEPSVCDQLPDDDSVCAHACDPAAVQAAIPPGTCAIFECPLDDGSVFRTGGCNP